MAKIRIIKKNNDCSMEYEVGDICEVTGTWYGGVHINGRSGIPVSLDKEEYMELNTEPEEPDSAENENTLETPEHDIHAGDIVQHFKREWVSPDTSEYLYKVLAVAHHTENGEKLMIYQALYAPFKICARPYDMFMSEVDHVKYPDVAQKYRFEQVDPLTMQEISDNLQYDNSQAVRVNSDNRIDEAYTLKEDSVNNSLAQPEQQVAAGDSVLDKFLDARGYEEKLDVLIRYKSRFTNPMIDIMAESLEIVVPEGELSGRIDSLRKVLQAHTKYEGSHLRP